MADLLPCPFCGQQAEAYEERRYWTIGCRTLNCPCYGETSWHKDRDRAAELWNARTLSSGQRTGENDAD